MCLFYVFTTHAALKIGVLFFDPPLVISASQGFHVDLAKQICAGLKQECIIKPMKWDQLFIALDKGDIDLQMGVYITPERAKKYIFTIPYLVSKGRLFALTKNHLTTISQLQGKTLGTLKEENEIGVFHKYIQNTYPNVFNVVDFDDIGNLVTALADKKIQVALLHAASADYWVANSSGEFSPIGGSFLLGGGYSLMALPSNQALVTAVDEQLKRILKSKDYDTIYTMYLTTHE
jgi:arginine transport system substrate-binding protein